MASEPIIFEDGERALLRGKVPRLKDSEPIILTNRRLIVGSRSIYLEEIREVSSKVKRESLTTTSVMIVRLIEGEEIELTIAPEGNPANGSLAVGYAEGAMFNSQKSTHDRWVILINRLLNNRLFS